MASTAGGRRHGRPTLEEAAALREAFLTQALVMLSERGVHGFSIDALAKTSGVTKRTIYRHYDSKATLIEAVVEREVLRLTSDAGLPAEGEAAPLERLKKWSWRFFTYVAREDTRRLGLLLRSASLTETWAADMLAVWAERLLESAAVLVVETQQSRELRPCDPKVIVTLLFDLLDGIGNRMTPLLGATLLGTDNDFEQRFHSRWHAFLQLARCDWQAPARLPAMRSDEFTE